MVFNQYTDYRQYPNYLLAFNSPPRKNHVRYQIQNERTNTKGDLSIISQRKIKHAINNLIFISEPQTRRTDTGEKFTFKINFITLNLPAPQFHTDKELKAILNDWIKIWAKKGLRDYVWKAEKQENGNIHFHITTNTYIHHSDIRNTWNSVLRHLGYIDKYREIQLDWHKDGFKFRPDMFRKIKGEKVQWTYNQQKEAYQRGKRENWTNPNTTDVHSVKNIKNLAGYLCDYMAKKGQGGIEGRLWGCSRNLLKKPDNLVNELAIEAHNEMQSEDTIHGEFYAILANRHFFNNKLQFQLLRFKDILRNSNDYQLNENTG